MILRATAAFSVLPILATTAATQNAVRSWGDVRIDTSAYDAPIDRLWTGDNQIAVIRSDHRIVIQGGLALPPPPAAPFGQHYSELSLGGSYGLALRNDGQIVSWGANGGLPAPPLAPNTFYTSVSAQHGHAVAIRSDGVAIAWGDNSFGQLNLPQPTSVPALRAFAYRQASVALLANGEIIAAGNNANTIVPTLPAGVVYTDLWLSNQLLAAERSDGVYLMLDAQSAAHPAVQQPPPGLAYTDFAFGDDHSIALRSDGALVGWGSNGFGQIAIPTFAPNTAVVQVGATAFGTIVRLNTGQIVAFGRPTPGFGYPSPPAGERWIAHDDVLGLASNGQVLPLLAGPAAGPLPQSALPYVSLASSSVYAAALRADGQVFAASWSTGALSIPPLPAGTVYTAVDVDDSRVTMLRSDGEVVDATNFFAAPTVPSPPPGQPYLEVSTSNHGTMVRRFDGSLLVVGGLNPNQQSVPPLPPGLRYESFEMLQTRCAAIRSDGEVIVWGEPLTLPPSQVVASYVELASDFDTLVARRSDGTVIELTDPASAPPDLSFGESFVEVAASARVGSARVGPRTFFTAFDSGCAGSMPTSRIVPRDTPRIGRTLATTVLNLPADLALLALGWNYAGPIPLAAAGMPGCHQHITVDVTALLSGTNHVAEFELAIPNSNSLVGTGFTCQALVFDPGANAASLVVSNASHAAIGRP